MNNLQNRELFTVKTAKDIKSLVSRGAEVNTRNRDEATPLLMHVRMGNVEIVQELIRHKAKINLQDLDGYTGLIVAAENGHLELVQILIAEGAILDLKESKVSEGESGREEDGMGFGINESNGGRIEEAERRNGGSEQL